jgi:hypothetical protein
MIESTVSIVQAVQGQDSLEKCSDFHVPLVAVLWSSVFVDHVYDPPYSREKRSNCQLAMRKLASPHVNLEEKWTRVGYYVLYVSRL